MKNLKRLLISGIAFVTSLFASVPAMAQAECPRDTLPTTMWVIWLTTIGIGLALYLAYDRKREQLADAENLLDVGREEKIDLMREISRLRRENKVLQASKIEQRELEENQLNQTQLKEQVAYLLDKLGESNQKAEDAMGLYEFAVEKYDEKATAAEKIQAELNKIQNQLQQALTNSVVHITGEYQKTAATEKEMTGLEEQILVLERQNEELVLKNSELLGEKQTLEAKIDFFSAEIVRITLKQTEKDQQMPKLSTMDIRDLQEVVNS